MCGGEVCVGEGWRAFYYTYRDDIQREKIVLCLLHLRFGESVCCLLVLDTVTFTPQWIRHCGVSQKPIGNLLVLIGKIQGLDLLLSLRFESGRPRKTPHTHAGVGTGHGDMVERSGIRDRRTLVERRDIPWYSFNGP